MIVAWALVMDDSGWYFLAVLFGRGSAMPIDLRHWALSRQPLSAAHQVQPYPAGSMG